MSLEEVFKRIGALREDLEELDVDVTVTVETWPQDFAARLRRTMKNLEAEG